MSNLVRSACLTHYPDVARAFGLNTFAQLRAVKLDPACLNQPDIKIKIESVGLLLENSARDAGIEDFGLRMAEGRQLSNLGPLALVMREEPTLRAALKSLQRYMHVHNEGCLILIEERDGVAVIRSEQVTRGHLAVRQVMELVIGVAFRLLKALLGEHWEPRAVCFNHNAPSDRSTYLRVFGPNVQFNSVIDGIVCRSVDLDAPIPGADPVSARFIEQHLDALGLANASVAETVRRLVWILLPTGHCSIEQVARQMGVDRRTVHRQLLRHEETFSSLLDQVRSEQVVRHLGNTERSLSEIAELLGFSALSAFSRWFNQRFGCSPKSWRSAHTK